MISFAEVSMKDTSFHLEPTLEDCQVFDVEILLAEVWKICEKNIRNHLSELNQVMGQQSADSSDRLEFITRFYYL